MIEVLTYISVLCDIIMEIISKDSVKLIQSYQTQLKYFVNISGGPLGPPLLCLLNISCGDTSSSLNTIQS